LAPGIASINRCNCSGGEDVETLDFAADDPYLTEAEVFIEAIRTGDASAIRCTYADAVKTHRLTWSIRRAAEKA